MRTALSGGMHVVPGGARGSARPATDWLTSTFVVLVVVAALVAVVSGVSSRRSAIRALPDERRVALLSRTVDELRQFCGAGRTDALEDHCHHLASFAAQFDECRGECEALVRRQLATVPTR